MEGTNAARAPVPRRNQTTILPIRKGWLRRSVLALTTLSRSGGSRMDWWFGFDCRSATRQRWTRTAIIASGGERVRMRFLVDRDRLEAIVAGAAVPEERRAARAAFDPIGSARSACRTGHRDFREANSRNRVGPWRISLSLYDFVFCNLWNETGLLSERTRLSPENSLHLHCVICTTIVRVRMTQIRVDDAMHRTAQRMRHAAVVVQRMHLRGDISPRCRRFFATSVARWWNYRNRKSLTRRSPEIVL